MDVTNLCSCMWTDLDLYRFILTSVELSCFVLTNIEVHDCPIVYMCFDGLLFVSTDLVRYLWSTWAPWAAWPTCKRAGKWANAHMGGRADGGTGSHADGWTGRGAYFPVLLVY
jgi:hypothetical protein